MHAWCNNRGIVENAHGPCPGACVVHTDRTLTCTKGDDCLAHDFDVDTFVRWHETFVACSVLTSTPCLRCRKKDD